MEDPKTMPGKTAVESSEAEPAVVEDAAAMLSDSEEMLDEQTLMQLIDESLQELVEGEVVRGRVLEVSGDEVIVDIGYKSEGIVRAEEFADAEGYLWGWDGSTFG